MAKHKVNWHLHMGKTEYRAGDVIELEAKDAAPLVGYGVLSPSAEEESSEVEAMSPSQIAKANKETLADYAKRRYGVELNPTDMTKDAMLAAVAECAATEEMKDAK